jgi:hypothetical protein
VNTLPLEADKSLKVSRPGVKKVTTTANKLPRMQSNHHNMVSSSNLNQGVVSDDK